MSRQYADPGHRAWPRCRTTKKIRFPTPQHAARELVRVALRTERPKTEIRSYRCPDCKGWHTTSHPYPPTSATTRA
jgi:hypothetical protein